MLLWIKNCQIKKQADELKNIKKTNSFFFQDFKKDSSDFCLQDCKPPEKSPPRLARFFPMRAVSHPTHTFTTLELQNSSNDVSEVHKLCRSPDYGAMKLSKQVGQSGLPLFIFDSALIL